MVFGAPYMCLSNYVSPQMIHVLEVKGTDLNGCKPRQYLLKGDKKCRDCAECPAGQMFTKHCGRKQDSNGNIIFIQDTDTECEPCKLGTFKTKKSKFPCKPCTRKCGKNREVIHPCNTTHNLLCSDCKKG